MTVRHAETVDDLLWRALLSLLSPGDLPPAPQLL